MTRRRGRGVGLSTMVFEFVAIVVGVLVALAVNEWRADVRNKATARTAVLDISAEIRENRARIERSIDEHRALRAHLQEAMRTARDILAADGDITDVSYSFSYSRTVLRKTAWESAIFTQAVEHMDMAVVQELSDIYELIGAYDLHGNRVMESMGQPEFYRDSDLYNQLRANLFNVETTVQLDSVMIVTMDRFLDERS